ncbi:RNA polymerase sigma factor SigF, partial [Actinoplanes sp. NPDC051494]
MTVTQTSPTTTPASKRAKISEASADSAADLLNAMAAMPVGHPSRARLRDRAIEAWIPLAR